MKIRMYECGFGDCFRLSDGKQNDLYVDFGIHTRSRRKWAREAQYDQIIHTMSDNSDFLLTHYHDDHYAGAIHMIKRGKQFQNVYLPDIWTINTSVEAIKLTLLRGLITKSVLRNGLSLIQFLVSICHSTGKIHFIKRNKTIQDNYIALWPDEDYINYRTKKLLSDIYLPSVYVNDQLTALAEKLRSLVLSLTEVEPDNLNIKQEIASELGYLEDMYSELYYAFEPNNNLQHKLSKYGNEISIVFQNKKEVNRNVLFTGDVGKDDVWEFIEGNYDGKIEMFDTYDVIKIPHHGTHSYYHSFLAKCRRGTILLIPNGQINAKSSWYIDERYSYDAMCKKCFVICSNNKACNAYAASHSCVTCPYIICPDNYIDIYN